MYQTNTFYGKQPVARIHLSNKVIHNLFISIIRLITFFTEKSNIDKTGQNIWTQISKSLNQNRREAYLFNCLDVPSDEVKLKVVRCLHIEFMFCKLLLLDSIQETILTYEIDNFCILIGWKQF